MLKWKILNKLVLKNFKVFFIYFVVVLIIFYLKGVFI